MLPGRPANTGVGPRRQTRVRRELRAENTDAFDFELATDELAAIKALDTGKSAAPPFDPADAEVVELFSMVIPEA